MIKEIINKVLLFVLILFVGSCTDSITQIEDKDSMKKKIYPVKHVRRNSIPIVYAKLYGKVGIWPIKDFRASTLSAIKNEWGFTNILVQQQKDIASCERYFSQSKMVRYLSYGSPTEWASWYQSAHELYPGINLHHIEEPFRNFGGSGIWIYINELISTMNETDPSDLLTVSISKRDLDNYNSEVDKIMATGKVSLVQYSAYNENYQFDHWDLLENKNASKSNGHWVPLHKNLHLLDAQCAKAKSLGDELWLYCGDVSNYDNMDLFLEAAFNTGWLKKFAINTYDVYYFINEEWVYHDTFTTNEWMTFLDPPTLYL